MIIIEQRNKILDELTNNNNDVGRIYKQIQQITEKQRKLYTECSEF